MSLIDFFVKNPAKVSVGVLLVALFGWVALLRMPMQLTPEVQTPTITVETRWPGASPQEVEQEIVIEQEEQLKGVEGVTKMTSESSDSSGKIIIEFLVGTDMQKAVVDVIGRLEQVREYPIDADKPVISTANANDRPIAWFILSARRPDAETLDRFAEEHPELKDEISRIETIENSGLAMLRLRLLGEEHPEIKQLLPPEDLDVPKLRRFAEDEIEARFERVAGVSQANVLGGLEDELQVIIDPERLAARQLTIAEVRNVLRGQNQDTSGGDYWEGKRRWIVRTLGQFRSPEQVEQQLLAVRDGNPVYVRDVATVSIGYKKADGLVRRFGESSIAVNALRETGANVLDVMDGLRNVGQELNDGILKDRGLQLIQVYDETEYIYSALDLVRQNIFIGSALTMVVLMLFLHLGVRVVFFIPAIAASAIASQFSPWFFLVTLALMLGAGFWFARGALIVGLAIPISIVGTFLTLGMLGRSLNVISLAGLAFAVGMLVDNAVVVLENIFRRWDEGEKPLNAAINGTVEVWGAVLSSTLTTIAVFLPIVFVQEEAGQLFRDIALAISGAVALSLVVSMTFIPMMSRRLLRDRKGGQPSSDPKAVSTTKPQGKMVGAIESFGEWVVAMTVKINRWILAGTTRRIGFSIALIGASLGISWLIWPKVEYLPTGNRNLVFGILLPPPGYNLPQLVEMGETVEKGLRPYWDVQPGSPEAAKLDFPIIGDFFFVARGRQIFMGIRAQDPAQVAGLIPLVQKIGSQLPGTFAIAKQSSLFEQGLTAGRTIDVEITGPELETLVGFGGQVLGKVKGIFPEAQARPIPSLDLSAPELHVRPRLMQAAEMGVNSSDLGYTVDALVDGAYAADYFLDGDKIDLTIKGETRLAERSQDIRALPIATPGGELVPLIALSDVELGSGPEQINHRERIRAITIEVSPPADVALEDAMAQIETNVVQPMIESGQLPAGYRINLAGTADKLRDTWEALRFNVLLALLITYLLMVALFESWLYPLVIILVVPLGAVGGILGLRLLNLYYMQSLDILTMLGFVILIGTVVNNPILIVHQSLNHMRLDKMPPQKAILESVRTRIRPIFMTTTTTVLGLLPLVLFPGAGSELYRGLGSVVLGGLVVSTVFTLFLVPTMFSLAMDFRSVFVKEEMDDDSIATNAIATPH
ncbi:efflux RND transporter permease subunit [Rhodopirellula sp. MGV]|uniref:efflux RND transporter permease subunit n=1 Tax=Rhodopirellula sp. MGV TaxID=2023130 RepID=UPI000B97090B|nr:efflux RND transporter permease subunit [Rhodopirellula sp. MGV]OYP36558.1 acriflavin resistance protein [Rhodopirellula sp. MGV]PNY34534.1 AcrB/AcrD/AcrF family protein [Rhodopirellula baltica]